MHPTISGATPKIYIEDKKAVDSFLDDNKELFGKLSTDSSSCLYEGNKIINDYVLNYLNITTENPSHKEVKKIIRREFDVCENLYPYLGDIFINMFFDNFESKTKVPFKFKKSKEREFLSSIKDQRVKEIAKLFFNNLSMEYCINVQKDKIDQIIIEKKNNLIFDIDYDYDYYKQNASVSFGEYNFIIIDGIIDSIGEIHHLLQKAFEDKEPYVIFCFGIHPEVKQTIMKNNSLGNTKVYPIDITVNEPSLNILNDIAVVCNDEVISAHKGQTISQSIRKKLKKGNGIKIEKNRILIKPVCTEANLISHRKFLFSRIQGDNNSTNISYLKKRYQRMNTKEIKIHIPEQLYLDNDFLREFDYLFRFLSQIDKKMVKFKNLNNKKLYYVPSIFINAVELKNKNIKEILSNIDKLILKTG